jgi:integrase
MGSVRTRKENGALFFDFRFNGSRCREQTTYPDTPENRARLEKQLQKIEAEVKKGIFSYSRHFPDSKLASKADIPEAINLPVKPIAGAVTALPGAQKDSDTPLFSLFANQWFEQLSVEWRRTYRATNRQILDLHLFPVFGAMRVGEITKDDILNFRSVLAKVPGRKKNVTLVIEQK